VSKEVEADPGNGTPEAFDPLSVPMDELRAKIESGEPAEETKAAGADEPTVEETPEEAEAAPEKVEVEATEQTEEEAPAGAKEATDEEPPSELDELRAEMDLAQARTKHFESLLGRQAGEDGFWKQKYAALEETLSEIRQGLASGAARATDDLGEPVRQAPVAPQRVQPQVRDENTSYIVGLAIKDAGQQFFAENPGARVEVEGGGMRIHPDIEKVLAGVDVSGILNAASPLQAQAELGRVLGAAWSRVDRDQKTARLNEIKSKRFEQGERLKKRKIASAASSTGSTGPKPKRAVDPFAIPMDELRKLAEQEAAAMEAAEGQ